MENPIFNKKNYEEQTILNKLKISFFKDETAIVLNI